MNSKIVSAKFISACCAALIICTAIMISCKKPTELKPFDVNTVSVDEFFQDTEGTFILKDVLSGKMFIYNEERAAQRFPPQSTFKIMNSLIGLEEQAVKDEDDVKSWDGTDRLISSHNQDHTLSSSMKYSVVWYYQAMARDIGEERMKFWLDKCSYGNRDISGGIDQFWLSSSLEISPMEQLEFLEKLYNETLPFNNEVIKTVKRIMILQEGDNYTHYGKTGSSRPENGFAMGWYAGFVIKENHPYIFVTNIDTKADFAGPEAKEITVKILEKYNLI